MASMSVDQLLDPLLDQRPFVTPTLAVLFLALSLVAFFSEEPRMLSLGLFMLLLLGIRKRNSSLARGVISLRERVQVLKQLVDGDLQAARRPFSDSE